VRAPPGVTPRRSGPDSTERREWDSGVDVKAPVTGSLGARIGSNYMATEGVYDLLAILPE